MFKVCGLSKKNKGRTILHDVSFGLQHGEIGVFLGASGAGKSTLLRVLNNLETYDSGEFGLDGDDLDLTKVNQTHTVGMVFQHFNLFEHLTVEENITLALVQCQKMDKKDAQEVAEHLLEKYGLADKVNEKVQRLSGGQKQRLAIARTLALNPKIVCLDEPTSALDPRLTNQVAQIIQGLAAEGRIIVLTTHDMNLVQQLGCDLFLMEQGKIIERGCASSPILASYMNGC